MSQIKTCKTCRKDKSVEEFYPLSKKYQVHEPRYRRSCKQCCNEDSSWRRKTRQQYVKDLKESNPCTDCNQYYPYYVMDYDHVRGEKIKDISDMWAGDKDLILAEIAKCDLVCANCHRIRTHLRKSHIPKGRVSHG